MKHFGKEEPLIFEKAGNNPDSTIFPEGYQHFPDAVKNALHKDCFRGLLREGPIGLPSLSELEVVRHFTRLAQSNFCVDSNFYPLGSCTMKYNPKINEDAANLEQFAQLHPLQDEADTQGILRLVHDFEMMLCGLTGMHRFTFQASAGAHGEFTGLLMIKKYFETRQDTKRTKIIVPDSSHGTNPASAAMCGFSIVKLESTPSGLIDIDKLNTLMDEETAGIMMTNPNTLGLFEENILRIQKIVHDKGGLLYYDGANFNALIGIVKPAAMGFDVIHLNLHKTFATPHGGGGPGAAAVGVSAKLAGFLPVPVIDKNEQGTYFLQYDLKNSIGKIRSFFGNIPVIIKAFAYMLRLGKTVPTVAEYAVLNAAYLREKLRGDYQVCSEKPCMHEVVFSAKNKRDEQGISAMDIAKRLIDYGIHPPTVYFPLIVREALMIEPTETESKETLDAFITVMRTINNEIAQSPDTVKNAPHSTRICRPDDTRAARNPDIRWKK